MTRPVILCVDANEDTRRETISDLKTELADLNLTFESAGTVEGATAVLETDSVACVITEYEFSDGTGFDVIELAREHHPDAGSILFTAIDPATIDTTALSGTITEYVGKESMFGTERLTRLIRTTIENRSQSSYPLPQDEDERLAALRTYDLDSETLQESLDRITDLAANHFDVEIASINIINEHSQDFLACYGETENWGTMEREDSICTFTILEDDDVMTVEDVTEDPRFETRSDALLDLGIHAYMGANLVTPNGLVIGPLCIYDDEPRSFSAADEAYLQDLASIAMDLIELHSRLDGKAEIPTGGAEP